MDPIVAGLGFYNIEAHLDLLGSMAVYKSTVVLIGLGFTVLLVIFVVISCLLIYSLLLISVETKTFENGVMRLVGLTRKGYVAIIMT